LATVNFSLEHQQEEKVLHEKVANQRCKKINVQIQFVAKEFVNTNSV